MNKFSLVAVVIAIVMMISGCSTNTAAALVNAPSVTGPAITGEPASLPLTAEVHLSSYQDIPSSEFFDPIYEPVTLGSFHNSAGIQLTEGQTVTITIEADCPIEWDPYDTNDPHPAIIAGFKQMETGSASEGWKNFNSLSTEILHTSMFDNDTKAEITITVHPINENAFIPDIFKLKLGNFDPDNAHSVRYTISQAPSKTSSDTSIGKPTIVAANTPTQPTIQTSTPTKHRYQGYITPDSPEVQVLLTEIMSSDSRLYWNDFNALRDWVSWHVSYRSDMEVHGVSEYWQTPAETLQLGTGDCEDFAILLCSLLRAYGVPADQVYVASGCNDDGCHAYLIERWYRGIWRIIEPQAGGWTGPFYQDWATDVSYDEYRFFNDQDYIKGDSLLPSGTYEFEVPVSLYPMTSGSYVYFTRYLEAGQTITGLVEWPTDRVYSEEPSAMVNDWSINVYGPKGVLVYSWSGKDLEQSFSYTPDASGGYKVEILKRDYLARFARLTINPTDWD